MKTLRALWTLFRIIPGNTLFALQKIKMSTNGIDVPPDSNPIRLTEVQGYEDRKNDIVYVKPFVASGDPRMVVFFPGDVQDYIENMTAHRDNKNHKEWNLEDTASKLQVKFPQSHVLVIKPSRMDYKTFSCFQNFVKSNQLGVPEHTSNYNSLRHLNSLVKHVSERLANVPMDSNSKLESAIIEIVGFSKGCVVLNQFLYEFHYFKKVEQDEEISTVISRITDMYWLDGGHSGGSNTWVNDRDVLETLCSLGINVHVDVSPYQIQDDRRPWIKKEEKTFSEYLTKNGCNISRQVHFENIPPSILVHFDIINAFKN